MNLAIAHRRPRPSAPKLLDVRPITPADLAYLREPASRTNIKKLRERHHQLCRLLALGYNNKQCAETLGYTESRVAVLRQDPGIRECTATYAAQIDEKWAEKVDQILEDQLAAARIGGRMIVEALEDHDDEGTRPPLKELIALTADRYDRVGYGKKQTNINVNVDFAKRLEAAITRSRRGVE